MKKTFLVFSLIVSFFAVAVAATITSTGTGNWNSTGTWDSGTIPTSIDNVTIASGHTVTIDISNAECNDLTVTGTLRFSIDGTATGITINGNVTVDGASGKFRCETRSPAGVANSYVSHTATIKGNLTVNTSGGVIDLRAGSNNGGTANGCEVTFDGNINSIISLQRTSYGSSVEEFNGITINKTGGAKVTLSSGNIFMSNNSSTGPCVLTLTSGNIETGSNSLVHLSTSSSGVSGGSSSSYVIGTLGRGMSTSNQANRTFQIGDVNGYRPILVSSTAGIASGGYIEALVVSGNADNASSFTGNVDKVSEVRYFKVIFQQGTSATTSTGIDTVAPYYGADDGVASGNTDLRVAYSSDNRVTWNGLGQSTEHTTSLSSPPTQIMPDAISPVVTLSSGSSMYVSLARLNGTTTNPLPVEVRSFSAKSNRGTVELAWSTATEVNNAGFEIQKSEIPLDPPLQGGNPPKAEGGFVTIGFINGAGTSNSPREYSFVEKNIEAGTYSYRLKQIDRDGKFEYSQSIEVNVVGNPTSLALQGNYPNPFNPTTNIDFTVPSEGRAVVKVFDILGKEVATVFNDIAISGKQYSVPFSAVSLPSGIYFSQLEFSGQKLVKKMLLMK